MFQGCIVFEQRYGFQLPVMLLKTPNVENAKG
jgi:hypothetical protein